MAEYSKTKGIDGTSLDPRFNNLETIIYKVKVVSESGHVTLFKFPLFEKDRAFACMFSLVNAPDMSFVSIGKEQA